MPTFRYLIGRDGRHVRSWCRFLVRSSCPPVDASREDGDMATRLPALERPPITFVELVDGGHELSAARILDTGATGVASNLWLTADHAIVLHPTGWERRGLRRRRLGELTLAELDTRAVRLDELCNEQPGELHLLLEVGDLAAVEPALQVVRHTNPATLQHLWLCANDNWRAAASWRELDETVRIVDSTKLTSVREGPERRAATLAAAGVDAIQLDPKDWTGGLTTLFHRFERRCLVRHVSLERELSAAVDVGIDGVSSPDPARMVEIVARAYE